MSNRTDVFTSVSGETAHVAIRGRIAHGEKSAGAVRKAVVQCLEPTIRMLVIDIDGVSKLDAAGMGALAGAYSAAQSIGARFELRNVPRFIRELLTITRLDTILHQAGTGPEIQQ
jgi:anti-anti-sigma factor